MRISDWSSDVCSSDLKDELVNTLRQKKYVDLLPAYEGVSYIEGKARIADGALIVDDVPVEVGKVILAMGARASIPAIPGLDRSEEHTSELQSLMRISYAVFCLKKTKHTELPQHLLIREAIHCSTHHNTRTP